MKAIIRTKGAKQLAGMHVQDIPSQNLEPHQLKIKMASSRINPVDIDLMKGMPFIKYKNPQIGGIDGSGEVIEIGKSVSNFQPGDQVFFYRKFTDIGSWAEEIVIDASHVAKIPSNISPREAGAISLPLLTAYDALQALQPQAGKSILIHGAAGGVGYQAVQIAKRLGLKVIGTAAKEDFEWLEKAGVDQMIDYRSQAFEEVLAEGTVDYVFDTVGGDVLMKSIELKPEKVISVHIADPAFMHKTGIKLPSFLKPVMKMAIKKYLKAGKKHQVEVIGQITGANGSLLAQASKLMSQADYLVKPFSSLALDEVSEKGLSGTKIGTVILFN